MYIEMDTIVMSIQDFEYWRSHGDCYLEFDYAQPKKYRLHDFKTLNEGYDLIREHYGSEDEYQEAVYDCDRFLYNEGYYLYDDDYGENDDYECPTWSYTVIDNVVVVTRAYLWS